MNRGNERYTPARETVNGSRRCVTCKESDLHCKCEDEHHRRQARRIIGRVMVEEGNDHE